MTEYREEFPSIGFELKAIADAAITGYRKIDRRLSVSRAASGLSEGVPSDGGFLLTPNSIVEANDKAHEIGELLVRADRQPLTRGNELNIPTFDETARTDGSRFGGVRLYWSDEAETAAATKPKFAALGLQLNKLFGIFYTSNELLADAPALGAAFTRAFGMEAAYKAEYAMIHGTGSGQPLGILNSGALITVTPESGQGANTIRMQNLVDMVGRLWGPSHPNAVWLMSNDAFLTIVGTAYANGLPVVDLGPDGRRYIIQIPVMLSEYPSTLGTAGDVILADFSQYILAERNAEFIASIHVEFLTDQSAFKVRYRIDGQPSWRTVVTPANSSNTQSPFVVLGGNR